MAPVAPTKSTRKADIKKMPMRTSPSAPERLPALQSDGPDVLELLLDISSWLHAAEVYIKAREEAEREKGHGQGMNSITAATDRTVPEQVTITTSQLTGCCLRAFA